MKKTERPQKQVITAVSENAESSSQTPEEETFSLEEAFHTLDGMILRLQDKDITLNEAVETYRKGMELCRICSQQVDLAEKQVIQLSGEDEALEF